MLSKRKYIKKGNLLLVIYAILFIALFSSNVHAEIRASYLYNLSGFNGPIPYNFAKLSVDKHKNEIYVINPREKYVSIFNENGMEIHRFGDDGSLGTIVDIAVESDGNIIVLSKITSSAEIIKCNFRGVPISKIELKNLPSEFSMFEPDRMIYREGRLYLADRDSRKIVVTDINGLFEKGYDIVSLIGVEEKKRSDIDIVGFNVDRDANMLFTIPPLFLAFRLSPDGTLEAFGERGGALGKFSVIGGIATDDRGYVYVADKLRCAVLVFDNNLEFQAEFGYRGHQQGNLLVPDEIVVDSNAMIYVAQAADKGVSVFKITYN